MESSKILFVISSPSGGGKTTLTRKLVKSVPGIKPSVSFTTREPYKNEKEGLDYHFVSTQRFDEMVSSGEMLEWAEIYGHRYGTCRHAVKQLQAGGYDVILTIDTQGAAQLRASGVEFVCIFLMPPSEDVLAERLHKRHRDSEEMINLRLAFSYHEFLQVHHYDYIVINDSINQALEELTSIIVAERCRRDRILPRIKKQWHEMVDGDPAICDQS